MIRTLRLPGPAPLLATGLLCLLVACSPEKAGGSSGDSGGDGADGADGTDGTDGGTDSGGGEDSGLPPSPIPFTLHVTGALNADLGFNVSACQWPSGTTNFRQFWRTDSGTHVFVLVVELLGIFEGPGVYDNTSSTARVKLQEEAGGSASYFYSDAAAGDAVVVTIEEADADTWQAWGEFSAATLSDGLGGSITLQPSTNPIWCETVDH